MQYQVVSFLFNQSIFFHRLLQVRPGTPRVSRETFWRCCNSVFTACPSTNSTDSKRHGTHHKTSKAAQSIISIIRLSNLHSILYMAPVLVLTIQYDMKCTSFIFLSYTVGQKNMKKRSEKCKHCELAVIRQSQKFSPRCRMAKFNQLEVVTAFTYKPSLVRIDAPSHKQTGPITIYCTAASVQCN